MGRSAQGVELASARSGEGGEQATALSEEGGEQATTRGAPGFAEGSEGENNKLIDRLT